MNTLDAKARALILRLLVEGNSIRATTRIADVSKNTVTEHPPRLARPRVMGYGCGVI